MKYFTRNGAPNPRRVTIYLAEKNITPEWQEIELDIFNDEHRSKEFTAQNPFQRVPTLELDNGVVISESIAICRYFEGLYPNPPLFGQDSLDEAIVEMWSRRMEMNFLLPTAMAFRHLHPKMATLEIPQIEQWGEVNKSRAQDALRIMDAQLKDNEFIAGKDYTIVDISATIAMDMLKMARIEIPDGSNHLMRWWQQIRERASYSS